MITVYYSTGNGYSCSCCRSSDDEEESFDNDQEAIDSCVSTARRYDWDFSVLNVSGAEDNDDLEKRIEDSIQKAKDEKKHSDRIAALEKEIAIDRGWIASVASETIRREGRIAEHLKELATLKGDCLAPGTESKA